MLTRKLRPFCRGQWNKALKGVGPAVDMDNDLLYFTVSAQYERQTVSIWLAAGVLRMESRPQSEGAGTFFFAVLSVQQDV